MKSWVYAVFAILCLVTAIYYNHWPAPATQTDVYDILFILFLYLFVESNKKERKS